MFGASLRKRCDPDRCSLTIGRLAAGTVNRWLKARCGLHVLINGVDSVLQALQLYLLGGLNDAIAAGLRDLF